MNISSTNASLWQNSLSRQDNARTGDSFTAAITAAQASVKTAEVEEPEKQQKTLENFRKELDAEINSILSERQYSTPTTISISDRAVEKMMNDPAAKEDFLRIISRETMASPVGTVHMVYDHEYFSSTIYGTRITWPDGEVTGGGITHRVSTFNSYREEHQINHTVLHSAEEKHQEEKAAKKKLLDTLLRDQMQREIDFMNTTVPTNLQADAAKVLSEELSSAPGESPDLQGILPEV